MKVKLLSAAISAIALAGFSQTSQAASYDIYLAGSSAQDNLVQAEIYNLITPSSFKYYIDNASATFGATNTGSWGSNYRVYTGTLATAVGSAAIGDTVTFHKVNFGGSAQGVAPLFQGVQVPTLSINNSNCYSVAGFSAKLANGTAVPTFGCTTTNAGDLPAQTLDAGLSDVNPTLFQGVNQAAYVTGSGASAVIHTFNNVTSVPAGFTVVPATTLVWAVPVSLNLYTALQVAQGLITVSGTTVSGCTAGAYTATTGDGGACMPSLNKSQLTSVISGVITDWNTFEFNGTTLKAAATAYDATSPAYAITPGNSGDTTVHFCQRLPGSGTAAAQYAYFLNQPANSSVTALQPVTNSVSFVYTLPDSGNIEKCLDDLANGTNNAKDYAGKLLSDASYNGTPGLKAWAIGQQSSDKNKSKSLGYRFIKINGVAPTVDNAFSGAYDFANESTWQYPTAGVSGRVDQAQALSIVKSLIATASNPAAIYNDLNQFTIQDFGNGGFAGVLSNALALNSAYVLPNTFNKTYPVTPWFHGFGTTIDNGSPQLLYTHGVTTNVAP